MSVGWKTSFSGLTFGQELKMTNGDARCLNIETVYRFLNKEYVPRNVKEILQLKEMLEEDAEKFREFEKQAKSQCFSNIRTTEEWLRKQREMGISSAWNIVLNNKKYALSGLFIRWNLNDEKIDF